MRKIPHIRWLIATMLFLAAILNYVDRQALSILAPTIQKDLNLSDAGYGHVVDLFLIAYTVSLLLSGWLVDKLGTRLSMAMFVLWWSISNVLTCAARSATSLAMCRTSLGFGEAGNWPGSTKAVSEWFTPKERAFAVGFYGMGATLGAMIAPPLILFVAGRWHWQAAFAATGILGLLWILPWLWLYRPPQKHPRITAQELATIRDSQLAQSREGDDSTVARPTNPWRDAFSRRVVWVLMLARMMTDPMWFFYQFWFVKYLFTVRHLDQQQTRITWVIYLAAGIGSVIGGLMSGFLIKRGTSTVTSRMLVMLCSGVLMPISVFIPGMASLYVALGFAMIAVFAHLAWLSNITALVVDLIPNYLIGTCFSIIAAGSAMGGIMMNKVVVHLVEHHSYAQWFTIMGLLHPAAWILLWASGLLRNEVRSVKSTAIA